MARLQEKSILRQQIPLESFISVSRTPKGTSSGSNGSSGVLIMSLSAILPEKTRGNKKYDKEEEDIFGLFGIAVKWPRHGWMQLF